MLCNIDTASDCSVFATCDAGTKLGIALNMQNEFKVSDPVLCDLEVPPATDTICSNVQMLMVQWQEQ